MAFDNSAPTKETAPPAPDSGGASNEAPGIFLPRGFLKAQFADAAPGDSGIITFNYTVNSADDGGVDLSFDSIAPTAGAGTEDTEPPEEDVPFDEGEAVRSLKNK